MQMSNEHFVSVDLKDLLYWLMILHHGFPWIISIWVYKSMFTLLLRVAIKMIKFGPATEKEERHT